MSKPSGQRRRFLSFRPKHARSQTGQSTEFSGLAAFFRKNRKGKIAAALVTVLIVLAVAVYNSQLCYAVMLNGETVGAADSLSQVTAVVDSVEKRAATILGYECSIEDQIFISAQLGRNIRVAAETVDLGKSLLGRIDGICQAYTVRVDGAEVGAIRDCRELDSLISGYLDRYTTEATLSIGLRETVYTELKYTSEESLLSQDELDELLNPSGNGRHRLTVVSTEVTRYADAIPFETICYDDGSMYKGLSKVTCEGMDGRGIYTEYVTSINGVTEGEPTVRVEVIKEATSEHIAMGSTERPRYASYGSYIWPARGVLTCYFGQRPDYFHRGLDIAGYYGQNIKAADGGQVVIAGRSGTYGNLVKILHDNGETTYYAHLSRILVSVGDLVARGDIIGEMGSTGNSTGVHLHFEIRRNGVNINPLNYLP